MRLYEDAHLILTTRDERVFIRFKDFQYNLQQFQDVLRELPRLQLTQFGNLRSALAQRAAAETEIGVLRPEIELTIRKDGSEASVRIHLTEAEFQREKGRIAAEVRRLLAEQRVTEGLLDETIDRGLRTGADVTVARAIPPVNGTDAQIRYIELAERVPTIRQDGSADYYEMNFIQEVQEGDWLGEKIPPTAGTPGLTVLGEPIPAMRGKDRNLQYDPQSVGVYEEDGKLVLRALRNGALQFIGSKVSVLDLLTIPGDVGPKTGNIKYDGMVQVLGTVQDGFTVHAVKDVMILGPTGIGMVERIVSETGDIYIKGGVFGRERAVVEAGGSVYLKHAIDCTIRAGDRIHIGLYAMGCQLFAKYIQLDSVRGKIVGGHVKADVQVTTGYIGNEMERETRIEVHGFDRAKLVAEFDTVLRQYRHKLEELGRLEQAMETTPWDEEELHRNLLARWETTYMEVKVLEERRKALAANLKTKGEGEVAIMQKAFPRTSLQIKRLERRLEHTLSGSLYFQNNQLHLE